MSSSKVFERMRQDHRHVLEEILVLERASAAVRSHSVGADWPGGTARAVLAMLARQFGSHMAGEDEVLFPALTEALPETRSSIEPLRADHGALRMMLADLEEALQEPAGPARNEQIAVQLRDFVDLLRIHIRKEEVVVFGVAERALSPREVETLAARMARGTLAPHRSKPRCSSGNSKGAKS